MPAPSAAPSRPPRLSLPPYVTCSHHKPGTCALKHQTKPTEGQKITSHVELRQQLVVRWPCRSKASPADVRERDESEKTRSNQWEWQKPLDARETCARTFRSMNLNARRRLGWRRQRDDDDQHVPVEHHRRCRLICANCAN